MSTAAAVDPIIDGTLPGERTTDLLRAILLDGDPARRAWDAWTSAAGSSVRDALAADALVARSFLPMILDSVRRNDFAVDDEAMTYLRAAAVTESMRTARYRAIVEMLCSRFDGDGIPFLLMKGAATSITHYRDPSLRHAHDVEFLVRPLDEPRVHRLLTSAGFKRSGAEWVHTSGLPVRIHSSFFPATSDADGAVWDESVRVGGSFRTPAPAHALALALATAFTTPARLSSRWVCDACLVIRRGDVHWPAFLAYARASGVPRAIGRYLSWISRAFELREVPSDTIATLSGKEPDDAEAEAILTAACRGSISAWRAAWRHSPSLRPAITRALLMPRPRSLGVRTRGPAWAAAAYGVRPAAYVMSFIRTRRGRRHAHS